MLHKINRKTELEIPDTPNEQAIFLSVPEAENSHLLAGAKFLIENVKDPVELLMFLNEKLENFHNYSLEYYQEEKKLDLRNDYFSIAVIRDELVIPMLKGGKELENVLAVGLFNLYDLDRYAGYHHAISNILLAHSYSFKDGRRELAIQVKELKFIQLLTEVGSFINMFEEEEEGKKEKAA